MEADLETAERYRNRAEELRIIAESMTDAKMRNVLTEVAHDYERMARSLETIDATEHTLAAGNHEH